MKRWEVVKGMAEGLYKVGDQFRVEFPDGDEGEAHIDKHGCLVWTVVDQHVHIASFNEDDWMLLGVEKEDEDKFVSIKQSHLDYLEERIEFLNCLEACGVDNWEGYGDAYQMMEEE